MEKKNIPKISRWALILQEYGFNVIHRPGSRMRHVDALSRMYFIQSSGILHNLMAVQQNDEHHCNKNSIKGKPF